MPERINCFLAAGIIGCAVLVSGCAQREVKNLDSRGVCVICLGDSVTFGYGAERGEDYPSVLAKFVSAPVFNAGVDSDTSALGLERLEADVLSKKPFLVIVEFGANDFLDKVPLTESVANMREIIRRIHQSGAMAAVVDISAGMLFREYRAVFSALAREEGAIFIPDALRGIITNPSLKSDFVHPNAKGYQLIAQRVFLAVHPYLLAQRRNSSM